MEVQQQQQPSAVDEPGENLSYDNDNREESEVELLAKHIEQRRSQRIPITSKVRRRFLKMCKALATDKGYENTSKLLLPGDLQELRDRQEQRMQQKWKIFKIMQKLSNACCMVKSSDQYMMDIIDKAIDVFTNEQPDDAFFHFRDFMHYYTVLESPYIWIRQPLLNSCLIIFLFYLMTPVIFCLLVPDQDVCPDLLIYSNLSMEGLISSLYFASTTMSTVGYGDVSVSHRSDWHVLLGILYMIASIIVMALCFSKVIDEAVEPIRKGTNKALISYIIGEDEPDEFLYKRIRRMRAAIYLKVAFQFVVLNLIGVFVSRAYVTNNDNNDEGIYWTWMESFYWAVQTTTTIGYGDMAMPERMRVFQIFYLTVSTYFVANAIGQLGDVKQRINAERRYYAWKRRPLSRSMVRDIKPLWSEKDRSIDQYEYALGSLLQLGKCDSNDLELIMNKFRELASQDADRGLIEVQSIDDDDNDDDDDSVDEFESQLSLKNFSTFARDGVYRLTANIALSTKRLNSLFQGEESRGLRQQV